VTDDLFPVALEGGDVPRAGDRAVVFHGVNKSGSLAMANVMREAYTAQGREAEFYSAYHRLPRGQEAFNRVLTEHRSGHAFFVSHYIYRDLELPPGALLVTQVRHPLPRVLSVYGWLKRNYMRDHDGSIEGYPGLESWIVAMKGRGHTQMSQFARPLGVSAKAFKRMTNEEIYERAVENFERDVVWHGIAELFEESIFALAHVCGLDAVPPWRKDTRNRWRQSLAETDERIVELIHESYEHEFRFYEWALARFRERIARIDFGPSLPAYKERCRGEYGERLVS
jgi:hypothetical protein